VIVVMAVPHYVLSRFSVRISINGRCTVDEIHRALGKVLRDEVGIMCSAAGLRKTVSEIRALREEFWRNVKVAGDTTSLDASLEEAGRVADFLELGELMVIDALHRVTSMVAAMDKEFFGTCTNTGTCEDACPKGISVSHLVQLNREYLAAVLRS
jgi:succinate dehydrogenase/fumarate reductase flavoprotein subunit